MAVSVLGLEQLFQIRDLDTVCICWQNALWMKTEPWAWFGVGQSIRFLMGGKHQQKVKSAGCGRECFSFRGVLWSFFVEWKNMRTSIKPCQMAEGKMQNLRNEELVCCGDLPVHISNVCLIHNTLIARGKQVGRCLRALMQRKLNISSFFANETKQCKRGKINACNPKVLMVFSCTVDYKVHLYFTRIKLS